MWLIMAVLSAFFAGITSILAKCGIKKTDSDAATAFRTSVVLLFAWIMVFIVGSYHTISTITAKSLLFLVLSALFAALTSILAKVGIAGGESNLGTAIRTGVVFVMAWLIVFMKGKQTQLKQIDKKEFAYLSLSGIATGSSWLCYYYAIQNGIVSVVVPIDKLSIVIAVTFSYIVFKERLSKKAFIGLLLMVFGTLIMSIWS